MPDPGSLRCEVLKEVRANRSERERRVCLLHSLWKEGGADGKIGRKTGETQLKPYPEALIYGGRGSWGIYTLIPASWAPLWELEGSWVVKAGVLSTAGTGGLSVPQYCVPM